MRPIDTKLAHANSAAHGAGCHCLLLDARFDRRKFLTVAAAAGLASAFLPRALFAAEGNYEAMVLTCIDPRFTGFTNTYVATQHWEGKYSHFSIAGAAIGAVAPAFATWHKAFWDNLATSIQLHNIKSIVALDHRDCGAAKIAYGAEKIATRDAESELHRGVFADFRKQTTQRHPSLKITTGLVGLDGGIQWFA